MQPSNEELIAALRHLHPYTIERPALFEFVEKLLARADEPRATPEKSVMKAIESINTKVFSDPPKTAEDRFPPQKSFPNTSMCPQCPWMRKYAEPQAEQPKAEPDGWQYRTYDHEEMAWSGWRYCDPTDIKVFEQCPNEDRQYRPLYAAPQGETK